MRFAEMRYFPDARFIVGDFDMFTWNTVDNVGYTQLPGLDENYGIAIEFPAPAALPGYLARYNSTTGAWGAPLDINYVPELAPYVNATWNQEIRAWEIGARVLEE